MFIKSFIRILHSILKQWHQTRTGGKRKKLWNVELKARLEVGIGVFRKAKQSDRKFGEG